MAFSDIKSYRCIIPSMRDIRDWALSWIIEKHWEKMKYKDPTQWLSLTASVFLAIGTTIWQLKLQLAFECSLQSGKGGMVWENSIEMCISPSVKPVQVWFMKQGTQSRCTGTTQRNGMGTEVGGGSQDRGHRYTRGWFMSMFGKNHHNIAKQLASNYNK